MTIEEFSSLQYGMFVHFGLYSRLARGEWVMNREQISPSEMEREARDFHPDRFDADEICRLAVDGGMKYIVFTTMHHEGFRMYDSALSPYNSMRFCGRDFVREILDAARRHGLKTGLYHSLNNWHDTPDAVDALEDPAAYETFIAHTFDRLKELVIRYRPFDIMWYDGWWPFYVFPPGQKENGWQAHRMNEELRKLQPGLIFNGRNGLPGDYATPEQELTAPKPWRPWEACMTLNRHWGYHRSDNEWKSPIEVINMLLTCVSGRGNLLLNIGPRGDGSVPERSAEIIRTVGQWLKNEGGSELLSGLDASLSSDPANPPPVNGGDFDSQGKFAVSGCNLYLILQFFPGEVYTLAGLRARVLSVSACGGSIPLKFSQTGEKVRVELPDPLRSFTAPVLKFVCDEKPVVYRTGGMRTPNCPHPRY